MTLCLSGAFFEFRKCPSAPFQTACSPREGSTPFRIEKTASKDYFQDGRG